MKGLFQNQQEMVVSRIFGSKDHLMSGVSGQKPLHGESCKAYIIIAGLLLN